MANKNVKKFDNKVYVRKITRNLLKLEIGSNKIGKTWRMLKKEGQI